MTVHSDIAAITPTATGKAVLQSKGTNFNMLLTSLLQEVSELQIKVKQLIADHPYDSVLSAAVVAGGSGGTNGAVTITGTTGVGTKFTAKGVISGGALSGPLTIVNAGSYSTDPTSLSAEPVTGGGLSSATVSLTMSGDLAVLNSLNAILSELL
jgi:hypothetical protein